MVRDEDEAIAFCRRCFGFDLLEDTALAGDKRRLRGAPAGEGRDAGRGRFFLTTDTADDADAPCARFVSDNVRFRAALRFEAAGEAAVFENLCGDP